jgi:hypothetical protein
MAITAVGCDDVICLEHAQDKWVISIAWTALSEVHSVCNSRSNGFLYIRTVSENFACFVDHCNVYATYFFSQKNSLSSKIFSIPYIQQPSKLNSVYGTYIYGDTSAIHMQ